MAGTRKTRDGWVELASKFETSGKKAEVFCREHGISATTFKWWRWRLRSETRRAGAREDVRLIAVDVRPTASTRATTPNDDVVRIALVDIELSFRVGTDVGYVSLLVEKLRSRC